MAEVGSAVAEALDVGSSLSVDDIRLILSALAPSVEDHKKNFLVHNLSFIFYR